MIQLRCPRCRGQLREDGTSVPELACAGCGSSFPVIAGIPDLRVFPDPYIDIEADRAKGRRIAERLDDFDFGGLIGWYYANTPAVPPRDAARYTRGLLAAEARARATLDAWQRAQPARTGTLLELGCGTAPLLVAAREFTELVGVDIAFRWLVVARKRLAEAHVSATLICACAEALPFADGMADVIAAESTLEVTDDQAKVLSEAHRVLKPGGALWLTTPNKWSVGPDPHVGTWAAGYLPERLVFRRVLREGGKAPRRRLLSTMSLADLLRRHGFAAPRTFPPAIPEAQRRQVSGMLAVAVSLYEAVRRTPPGRWLLLAIGPIIAAVTTRQEAART